MDPNERGFLETSLEVLGSSSEKWNQGSQIEIEENRPMSGNAQNRAGRVKVLSLFINLCGETGGYTMVQWVQRNVAK